MEINDELVDKIIGILNRNMAKKIKIAVNRLYISWQEFLD